MNEDFPFPDTPGSPGSSGSSGSSGSTSFPVTPPAPVSPTPHSDDAGKPGMALPLLLFLISVFFWDTIFIWPIKILTVFFHELSHGLAAVFTGGSILRIELSANEGGVCWNQGGIRWIVLSAGYLGSLLWGGALFLTASRTRLDRYIVQGLAFLLIGVTFVYVRTLFGFLFGLITGLAMLGFARKFGEVACDQFLRYLGLTSMFYVILDIKSDLISRTVAESDAARLGSMIGVPGWLIGGVWFLIALVISYHVIRKSTEP
jgi:hypothetical protein